MLCVPFCPSRSYGEGEAELGEWVSRPAVRAAAAVLLALLRYTNLLHTPPQPPKKAKVRQPYDT